MDRIAAELVRMIAAATSGLTPPRDPDRDVEEMAIGDAVRPARSTPGGADGGREAEAEGGVIILDHDHHLPNGGILWPLRRSNSMNQS